MLKKIQWKDVKWNHLAPKRDQWLHSNKSLGSIKCGSILEQIRNHWLLKQDLAPRC